MYGIVLDRTATNLTLVVERDWFKTTYPKKYAAHLKQELDSAKAVDSQTLTRLESWKKERPDDEGIQEFIEEETTRINNKPADINQPLRLKRFTLVSYRTNELKGVYVQPGSRRQIAGCAWKHKLKRVTVRTVTSLQKELKGKGVDIQNENIDLSSEISESKVQSDEAWAKRKALFEYALREPLDYQGMGSRLFRTSGPNAANPQDLLGGMLGGGGLGGLGGNLGGLGGGLDLNGIQELLGGLEEGKSINDLLDGLGNSRTNDPNKNQWWKKATDEAAADGYCGVKITRLIQNPVSNSAKVETHFFARMNDGNWKSVGVFVAIENASNQDAADIERIKGDPQVKKILDTLGGLGLGGQTNGLLDKAIRQGAATEKAMQESNRQFNEFLDRHTVNSQSPPLH